VQTDLGGPAAPLTIDQSIPGVADTIASGRGQASHSTIIKYQTATST
jgi:hypothetical protein